MLRKDKAANFRDLRVSCSHVHVFFLGPSVVPLDLVLVLFIVSVCLMCGSEGFPEWLVFCSKCQVHALHRYCLDGPTIFDDDVTWFCEDCEPEKPQSLENSTSLPRRTGHNRNLERDTIAAYSKHKNHIKRVKKNYRKQQKIMKKQKDLKDASGCLDEPKVALPNCSNSTSHGHQNHSRRLKNNNHKEEKKCMKKHKGTTDISSYVNTRQESSPNCHTSNHDRICCSEHWDQTWCSDKEQKKSMKKHEEQKKFMKKHREKNKLMKQLKEQKKHEEQKKFMKKREGIVDISGFVSIGQEPSHDCHTSSHNQIQCSEPCDQTECGDNFEDTVNSGKVSDLVQNSRVFLNDTVNANKLGYWADAQPVAQPIWSQGISGPVRGLVAHASTLACSKVLDETKLLPEVLCADVLNRSTVWPKGFKDLGPTTESIALYIFPETERDEKAFDRLVNDIIFLDLAIRVEVVNAEFLVFPSTVLPTQCWRLNAKYYLWGVFRSKQASKTN
ncbi:uncharacterized protein LOC114755745 isoform X2 [Neltuma alba]|uniref:uncharacterized protein LOC114755745 isoform X2 n=1 Tax=Neltuma alba TaxID=207710 RepID=UPI0010A3EA47|nr:uncharacterized protein LOC114755745 isoform X2 [Prosopis alba]